MKNLHGIDTVNLVQNLCRCVDIGEVSKSLSSSSIEKVPDELRGISPSSFIPRFVCIGPVHRSNLLLLFSDEKGACMHDLLKLVGCSPEQTLNKCVEKVVASMGKINKCYENVERLPDSYALARNTVEDACFILQFLHTLYKSKVLPEYLLPSSSIIYDLVLLENQIPFFVLQDIFNCTILKFEPTTSLTDLILKFAQIVNVFDSTLTLSNLHPLVPHDHILGFLQRCYGPSLANSPSQELPSVPIHATVELDRAGVIFKPNRDERWQLAMEFKPSTFASCGKPIFKMPVLRLHNFTEVVLRNLIAYERKLDARRYVTSYAMAMDMLVDTEQDIAKLMESKVVVNHFGSNQKAADLMNSLCKNVPSLNFCYNYQWRQLDARYNSYWPKNIAALKRTYFSSPWSMIALLAGIAIFALTVVQTIFTVNVK